MSYECPDCILVSQSYVAVFLLTGGVLGDYCSVISYIGDNEPDHGRGGMFKMKHNASDFTSKRCNNKDNNATEMRIK